MTENFDSLGLNQQMLQATRDAGYTKPTDIQAEAIPEVLAGRDLIGLAQTGTGKTAAFTLPILSKLAGGRVRARMPRALILEPTRELAAQVEETITKLDPKHNFSMALLIGGVSFDQQDVKLARGVDLLIATPGRLLDHFGRGKLLMTGVDYFVIDEADRMLDMGFIPDIERIAKLLPPRRQTLCFSATMSPEIDKLTRRFLKTPVKIQVAATSAAADTIEQCYVKASTDPKDKRKALCEVMARVGTIQNAIVFCNRKRDVGTVANTLKKAGFVSDCLHGDMDQRMRTEALAAFKNNDIQVMVASDVAARGLDIPAVSHVFNFDVPSQAEDYVHRIGRTGRAGRKGSAITLVTDKDTEMWKKIMGMIDKTIPHLGDSEPVDNAVSTTKQNRDKRTRTDNKQKTKVQSKPQQSPALDQKHQPPPKAKKVNDNQPHPSFSKNDLSAVGFGNEENVPNFMMVSAKT